MRSVTEKFNQVAEKAVLILVSVIYSDLEEVLVDFDTLWFAKDKQVTQMIATTLRDYFKDINEIMESHYFKSVVLAAAKSCVLRYLLFLRDRVAPLAGTSQTNQCPTCC